MTEQTLTPVIAMQPNQKVVEFCEELLARAKSGDLRSLAIVEYRTGDRMDASFREIQPIDALKAVSFMGMLVTNTFMNPQNAAPGVNKN